MSALGSLLFCNDCGCLLDSTSADQNSILTCEVCGGRSKDTSSKTVTTQSKPSAFPSSLRSKRSAVQTLTADDMQTEAIIRHACPECGRQEMRYHTVQLRSADEGSTIFYTCECGHKFSENN